MNIQQYISSGIIEGYLLGLVSEEESAELEHMCLLYPELNIELDRIEKMLYDEVVLPPIELKDSILNRIESTTINDEPETFTLINLAVKDDHITVSKHWKTVFVLFFIVSKLFLFLAIFYYYKYRNVQQQLDTISHKIEVVPSKK